MKIMKKTLISILTLIMALSLCSCGNVEESDNSDNKETTTTTTTVTTTEQTTTTTQVTTTQATTTTTEIIIPPDEPHTEDVVDISFESYDELKSYLAENFEGYNCYLPEVDSERYTFKRCHMLDISTGHYLITFTHNNDEEKNVTVYATPQTEALTFDDIIEEENAAIDISVSKDNIWDNENSIYYWNDPWTPESPYTITHVTDDGLKIFFSASNDFSTEEIKEKFDEFMAVVIED